ncbi:hypothetical protein OHA27_26820 [Streptomyces sp. NBC_01619]|uniref:Uncharacterized protein n=1 Tax=Streptomyces pratisoli TaxID=3139917 RepID=A0ACC6QTC1_9ACTN|nr:MULTISPECIES: hypothetical protein [unclassified Streptomyces]MCX4513868.1 hypothetical protein [Streptomyces sp. NBC_01619]
MVSVTRAAHNIEITAESLQADLNRLEVQKQALERELAAVVAHLDSLQRALGALKALALDTAGAAAGDSAGSTGSAGSTAAGPGQASARVVPQTDMSSSGSAKVASKTGTQTKTGPQVQRSESRKSATGPATAAAAVDAERHSTYGRLTEQIVEYFATVGDADVRARDVAAALGRDADSGSINAVRSTLDRLVGASRIRRTGRGLYRAGRS